MDNNIKELNQTILDLKQKLEKLENDRYRIFQNIEKDYQKLLVDALEKKKLDTKNANQLYVNQENNIWKVITENQNEIDMIVNVNNKIYPLQTGIKLKDITYYDIFYFDSNYNRKILMRKDFSNENYINMIKTIYPNYDINKHIIDGIRYQYITGNEPIYFYIKNSINETGEVIFKIINEPDNSDDYQADNGNTRIEIDDKYKNAFL